MNQQSGRISYVLISPARNEQDNIERTIQSIINQTHLPIKWVIVNDGSTDSTAEIVRRYLPAYNWIELIEMPVRRNRSFAAKVASFNAGYEHARDLDYEVIGNLDADLSFEKDYLEFLMGKFAHDPSLGVAGTTFKEEGGYSSDRDSFEGQTHVPGGCQLFRRECFEQIGGYVPIKAGGIDWIAVTTARMQGWRTKSFREKWFFHHRSLGTAERSRLASAFSYGEKDYYLGGHPLWELFRVVYRTTRKPYVLAGAALGLGYLWALLRRTPRAVSKELMKFHRREQMLKLKTILKSMLALRRIDSFHINTELGPSPLVSPPSTRTLPLDNSLAGKLQTTISRFILWLDQYGETSYDFQTFYASPVGQKAKALYYKNPLVGTIGVAPIIFCEAFVPSVRRLFWKRQRFPIADAHYAMGFAILAQVCADKKYYQRAIHFLDVLETTCCAGQKHNAWGYPFDWVWAGGTIKEGTPLVTTEPYVYEAFSQAYDIDKNEKWRQIMQSLATHVSDDYFDMPVSARAASASYCPSTRPDSGMVVNANAYRAFLLTKASLDFSEDKFREQARRNMHFVLESQNSDGSWYYAMDGKRKFVDHFHTCFVMKALAKIERLTGDRDCTTAIERGIDYYLKHLFDDAGLPKPFSKAPRLTVYRRELYDYAECINLATLLRGRFPELDKRLSTVLDDILTRWQRPDGSFRSRELLFGWDNVPMHRWAQAQLFRSLCLLLANSTKDSMPK
jgi:glycosyltransferase involved in cell wall biosynthesis